jgi:hypothetical protein
MIRSSDSGARARRLTSASHPSHGNELAAATALTTHLPMRAVAVAIRIEDLHA